MGREASDRRGEDTNDLRKVEGNYSIFFMAQIFGGRLFAFAWREETLEP